MPRWQLARRRRPRPSSRRGARSHATHARPCSQHPGDEDTHGGPFEKGGHGAIVERHADHKKADGVVARIAKEIEGVGLATPTPATPAATSTANMAALIASTTHKTRR